MAYDEALARRVSNMMKSIDDFSEKKMFGGVGYLIKGNMAVGVHKNYLIVRVGVDQYSKTLEDPNTLEFDITGRPMKGWIMVKPEGITSDLILAEWINKGVIFSLSLPPK